MDALHKLKKKRWNREEESRPTPHSPLRLALSAHLLFFSLSPIFFSTFSPTVVLGPRLVPRRGLNLILFKSILIQTQTELNMVQKDIQNSL